MKKVNKEDEGKVLLLRIIIGFTVVLIIATSALLINNIFFRTEKETDKVSTTRRRTMTTTTTEEVVEEETTTTTTSTSTSTTTTTTSTTKESTTSKKTSVSTTKGTTTSSVSTTKKTTGKVYSSRNIVDDATDYPDAVDSWEWAIVDKINEARANNGFKELKVDGNMRTIAENGANLWRSESNEYVKNYLKGYNNYRAWNNGLDETGYNEFYNNTINKTDIVTNKSYRYVGVGVILDKVGVNYQPTYYYAIIYE